jgi:predicted TPR repeat methyltransferase
MPISDEDMVVTARLGAAYEVETKDETQQLYDDWAEGYAAEMAANGYAAPARVAAALAKFADDAGAPVLDLGCGVGLSGAALRDAGLTCVDGTDFSDRMLDAARRSGVYRAVIQGDLEAPLPAAPDQYTHMTAVGVLNPGHAPAAMIEAVMAVLPRGGCFAFTLNDHAMKDPTYVGRIRELIDTGYAAVLFKEHGDHLPGIGLMAEVWVLRRN